MSLLNEVTIYRGDTLLCEGTVRECAKLLGVKVKTIKFYLSPAYERRLSGRRNLNKSTMVVRL